MKLLQQISLFAAVVGTMLATYTDIKRNIIPDSLSHGMIVLGAILLYFSYPLDQAIPFYAVAIATFLIGLLLYFGGQIGGGDVKLFTALALLIPQHIPTISNHFGVEPIIAPYPFIISIFFLAAVLSVLFVSSNYLRKLLEDRKRIKEFRKKVLYGLGYCLLVSPLLYFWSMLNIKMLVISVPLLAGAFILAFKDDILRRYVVMKKRVRDLTDDDVIAIEMLSDAKRKRLGLSLQKTLLTSQLKSLKKRAKGKGIATVPVLEFLPPFGPFIVVSLAANLIVGDFLLWLLFL